MPLQVERPKHGAPWQRPGDEWDPFGATAPGRTLPARGEELGSRGSGQGFQVLRAGDAQLVVTVGWLLFWRMVNHKASCERKWNFCWNIDRKSWRPAVSLEQKAPSWQQVLLLVAFRQRSSSLEQYHAIPTIPKVGTSSLHIRHRQLGPQVYRELIDPKVQSIHRGSILPLKLKASRTDRGPALHDGFQIAHYAGRPTWWDMVFTFHNWDIRYDMILDSWEMFGCFFSPSF